MAFWPQATAGDLVSGDPNRLRVCTLQHPEDWKGWRRLAPDGAGDAPPVARYDPTQILRKVIPSSDAAPVKPLVARRVRHCVATITAYVD
jgi:hypothetical protein